jgi:hypothetical protein
MLHTAKNANITKRIAPSIGADIRRRSKKSRKGSDNVKSGLDYFSLDVHLDEKFELIEAEFGLKGFAVIVKLFQKIYGQQGYYCEWTEEIALLFARNCCYSNDFEKGGNAVSEIVSAAIKRGIFDKELYEKYGILTSAGIQKRYFEACARRKEVTVKKEYLLLCNTELFKNVHISSENVNISKENVYISQQSKVKESKVKKSKVIDTSADASASVNYKDVVDTFNRICVDLPKVREVTEARRVAIRKAEERLRDEGGFEPFFEQIHRSDFLCGRGKGDRPWKCSFDWVLKPSNMVKILEGNFDSRTKPIEKNFEEYERLLAAYRPKYKGKGT